MHARGLIVIKTNFTIFGLNEIFLKNSKTVYEVTSINILSTIAGVSHRFDLTQVSSRLRASYYFLPKPVLFDINVYRWRHMLTVHAKLDAH